MSSLLLALSLSFAPLTACQDPDPGPVRIAFVGLHGGEFEKMLALQDEARVVCTYLTDQEFTDQPPDLTAVDALLLQHIHAPVDKVLAECLRAADSAGARPRTFALSGGTDRIPGLATEDWIEVDPVLQACYRAPRVENFAILLKRVGALCTGKDPDVGEPLELDLGPIHHPARPQPFAAVAELLDFARQRGVDVERAPRVAVTAHATHYLMQQPRVVAALVEELEQHGVLAFVAIDDFGVDYQEKMLEIGPDAVIHSCHSRDELEFRLELGVPHTHSAFFRQQSIAEWRDSPLGLSPHEIVFHCATQELLGGIEPFATCGTLRGGGSEEDFTPIPDRITRLVERTLAYVGLQRKANADKKVAFVYYDREASRSSLFRGSPTGMFLNAPRSVLNVLGAMREAGYRLDVPDGEDELIARAQETGRVVGLDDRSELEALADSGKVPLVPVAEYLRWLEERVPADARAAIERNWGAAPGTINVVERGGEQFLVVPLIDLGNVVLLPQPLRGEAYDPSQTHDKLTPPPHSYLAVYFWIEAGFGADAMVHFGTHGSEFLLPGKSVGLSETDWPGIVAGKLPNFLIWVVNNVGESVPAKRRTYSVIVDHLVPPTTEAGLADGLALLHDDVDRFARLEAGVLREKLRESITARYRQEDLDQDLGLAPEDGGLLDDAAVDELTDYLHAIAEELTPTSLHMLGEPPADDARLPWLVHCGGSTLLEELDKAIGHGGEHDHEHGHADASEAAPEMHEITRLRAGAEQVLRRQLRDGFSALEAVRSVGGEVDELSEQLAATLADLAELDRGLQSTGDEIGNLLVGLEGRFVPPGPGNSPDRNPGSVPTGRNMFLLNPREIPTRESWAIGSELAESLARNHFDSHGEWPTKIAFDLRAGSTWRDFGVMEAQILKLLGCAPVRDDRGRVFDVELIPREELGRPRIDVFVRSGNRYNDMLGDRLKLIDRAIRLAGEQQEDDNGILAATTARLEELAEAGITGERAAVLAAARIFGPPPGVSGPTAYRYLLERSGDWEDRGELMEAYLQQVRYAYTEGAWGEESEAAFTSAIRDAEYVVRNWSDSTRGPTTNRYQWMHGGTLALAVEHVSGKRPVYLLSDLRNLDKPELVVAEEALRRDLRVRAFNRKWIEGLMKEGYAGADQLQVATSNAYGWSVMRSGSVPDEFFEKFVDLYVRDTLDLGLREFFERENPWALQGIAENLLEVARKGMWEASEETLRELAEVLQESRDEHGAGGGLLTAGNARLEEFVAELLGATADPEAAEETSPEVAAVPAAFQEESATAEVAPRDRMAVEGVELTEKPMEEIESYTTAIAAGCAALLVLVGFLSRRRVA